MVRERGIALSDHIAIREALTTHGGDHKRTQGDSFLATITAPSDCVASAIQIQRELDARDWPRGEQLRVRIGVHVVSPLRSLARQI